MWLIGLLFLLFLESKERYYLLCDVLAEDKTLREFLQKKKLVSYLNLCRIYFFHFLGPIFMGNLNILFEHGDMIYGSFIIISKQINPCECKKIIIFNTRECNCNQKMYKQCASINKDDFALHNLRLFFKACMLCVKEEYLICNDKFQAVF